MSDNSPETVEKLEQNARRVITLLLFALVPASIYSTVIYFVGQVDVFNFVLTWVVTAIAGVAFGLSRRGKGALGVLIVIGVIWLAILSSPLRNSGNGLLLGVFNVLLTLAIAPQTLKPRQAFQIIMAGLGIGLLTLFLDWYWPVPRPLTPASVIFIVYVFGFGLILVNGYFLFQQIQTYSLRAKLTLAFLVIVVLSVTIVGGGTTLVTRTELTRQVSGNVNTLANTLAQQVGNALNSQIEVLQVAATRFERIAESASIQYSGSAEDIQRTLLARDQVWRAAAGTDAIILEVVNNSTAAILRDIRRTVPAHVEIFLTDVYGANIAATNRTTDYYQADETWWQAAYNNGEGATYISHPIYDESSEVLALEMAVPVFANGRLVGILRSTYEADVLIQILENVEIGSSGVAVIQIANDLLLGGAGTGLQEIDQATQTELRQLTGDIRQIDLDGREVLASQTFLSLADSNDPQDAAITNLGWSVIVYQDVTEALAPVETATRTIVLVSIGILLGTGVLAYYISFNFSTPIIKLTEVAEQVRAGNLDIQAEVTTQDEIGTLATSFNSMTTQVRTLISTLEQRVAERTRALATSTEVSRRLSTILDQEELVRAVVEQVQQAFQYYHAHIYLWDEKRENLVMAGGTGEAGRLMLESGHSIPAERGLVGRAAETGTVILVPDVTQTIGWLPNPLLPDTKAEIAVPIVLGDTVLGVLDIQQNVTGGLAQNDADLLQAIANQVAIALQNARAYAMAQQQVMRETRRSEIIQKIQSATSVAEALKVAVREVGRTTGQEAFVRLETMQNDKRG